MGDARQSSLDEMIQRTGAVPESWIAPDRLGHEGFGSRHSLDQSSALCHLGNIATRVRATLDFDPSAERMLNSADANALVKRSYRDGHWAVPHGV